MFGTADAFQTTTADLVLARACANPMSQLRAYLVLPTIVTVLGAMAFAKSPVNIVTDRDGSSFQTAIVVRATDEQAGVEAEFRYVAENYPAAQRNAQLLVRHDGRTFDLVELTTRDGRKRTLYFDISSFFGKP
ncbi:MAG: hypothetical protein QOE34_399 [Verrucomicrobiota bacterium]|jgi:hypothetical protein